MAYFPDPAFFSQNMVAGQVRYVRGLRTLLVLGRVSNLPSVWSNCVAGWLLAGGGEIGRLIAVCLGGTLMYLGGMYLNDAFDAQFDAQHRPERPIPSGEITAGTVWQLGFGWLLLGMIALALLGPVPGWLGVVLALNILIYDAVHKIVAFSPLLMAACRFWLVLIGASAAQGGINGLSIWSGLALASYVIVPTHLARRESTHGRPVAFWPCIGLLVPPLLAVIVNPGEYFGPAIMLCLVLVVWEWRCLRLAFWSPQPNLPRSVAGLLAGIVLVDWLAVGPAAPGLSAWFVGFFLLGLFLQRFVPAT